MFATVYIAGAACETMTNNCDTDGPGGCGDDEGIGELPLSLDAMLELASYRQRRYLLTYLIDSQDDAVTITGATE